MTYIGHFFGLVWCLLTLVTLLLEYRQFGSPHKNIIWGGNIKSN